MNPYLQIGINSKNTPLYKSLTELINKHGGRQKLADALEAEMVKLYLPRVPSKGCTRPDGWTKEEDQLIYDNFKAMELPELAKIITTRSIHGINRRIYKLQQMGLLYRKPHYKTARLHAATILINITAVWTCCSITPYNVFIR